MVFVNHVSTFPVSVNINKLYIPKSGGFNLKSNLIGSNIALSAHTHACSKAHTCTTAHVHYINWELIQALTCDRLTFMYYTVQPYLYAINLPWSVYLDTYTHAYAYTKNTRTHTSTLSL